MKQWLITTYLICCSVIPLSATADTWGEITKDYNEGRFSSALEKLKTQDKETPDYHYTAGNIYFRLNQFGLALAHFEKANHLAPYDGDIQHNLNLAQKKLKTILGVKDLDPGSTWWESLADQLPLSELRAVIGLFALILAFVWIREYYRSRRLRQSLTRPSGLVGLALLLLTIGLYATQRIASHHPSVVLIRPAVVRSGPSETFVDLKRLSTGLKLRLLGPQSVDTSNPETGLWRQVRFEEDSVGWIQDASLLPL